jgi:hypothetical protein
MGRESLDGGMLVLGGTVDDGAALGGVVGVMLGGGPPGPSTLTSSATYVGWPYQPCK